jgi:hypothetical protein
VEELMIGKWKKILGVKKRKNPQTLEGFRGAFV